MINIPVGKYIKVELLEFAMIIFRISVIVLERINLLKFLIVIEVKLFQVCFLKIKIIYLAMPVSTYPLRSL